MKTLDTYKGDPEDMEPLKQKKGKMILFMFIMVMGAFNNGYAMPEVNQLGDLFDVKYHWDT